MQIQITITPTDLAEASEILARIGAQAAIAVTPAPVPAPEKVTRTRRTKAEIEAAQAAEAKPMSEVAPLGKPVDEAPAPAPAPAQPPVEDAKIVSEPALDYERDVMPALKTLAADPVTLKQVVAVLGKYGVKRGQDVRAEDLAAFKADIDAIGKEEAGVL